MQPACKALVHAASSLLLLATNLTSACCCCCCRCSQDVEIEMDRFEQTRDATLAKFRMMRPQGNVSDALDVAVDGIATLCMGELADTNSKLVSECHVE